MIYLFGTYVSIEVVIGLAVAVIVIISVISVVIRAITNFNKQAREQGEAYEYKTPTPVQSKIENSTETKYDHPYPVGARVLVGKSGGGQEAFLVIKNYDEDESRVYCELVAETPAGAMSVFVSHNLDEEFPLGIALIHYSIPPAAFQQKIPLSSERLEEGSYEVVINVSQTTDLDLKSTH